MNPRFNFSASINFQYLWIFRINYGSFQLSAGLVQRNFGQWLHFQLEPTENCAASTASWSIWGYTSRLIATEQNYLKRFLFRWHLKLYINALHFTSQCTRKGSASYVVSLVGLASVSAEFLWAGCRLGAAWFVYLIQETSGTVWSPAISCVWYIS